MELEGKGNANTESKNNQWVLRDAEEATSDIASGTASLETALPVSGSMPIPLTKG
jgi:hypothetical protein